MKAAQRTKGGSGPSGLDADGWRKPLTSKVYGENGRDLRTALANVTKKICREDVHDHSLEAFLACRLVPLDKQPGLRPIGVGEVLRRVSAKVVMSVVKKDVVTASSKIQMCSGQEAGCEAAIHSMRKMFEGEESEAVILVDAANAFNSINREALIHNLDVLCPIFGQYVRNCYRFPVRLFVIGGSELKSKEGTTQGDPAGMAIYAIGLTPLLDIMLEIVMNTTMVAFADDISAIGKCEDLRTWWNRLIEHGPLFGYYPEPTKSWLIVKQQHEERANEIFQGSNIQISTRGKKHLGAVIGSTDFKKEYCEKLVDGWVTELNLMAEIAMTQPQAVYACYVSGYQHKFTYHLRTIPGIEEFLAPLEECIRNVLIPSITGGHIVNDEERELLALPSRLGGMGIKVLTETAAVEFKNSNDLTQKLQSDITKIEPADEERTRQQIKNERRQKNDEKLEQLRSNMSMDKKRQNDANKESGASNWLTSLPLKDQGYALNKQQFWDALRIRYNWFIPRLPAECACGAKFDVSHALSCKKGGFVSMPHNEVRDITGKLMDEVCIDVRKEPMLLQLNGEPLYHQSANRRPEARLDISANGFWTPGQRVFLDVRVFDLNAQRYRGLELHKCFKRNEDEKKRMYNQRVLEVENATFTPLVFATNGGMGRECRTFFKRLAQMISEKRHIDYAVASNFIRTKLSFSLLRSTLLCIRGSRTYRRDHELSDMEQVNILAHIRQIE